MRDACNSAPPTCAAGELAEVANGCYTGLCLPTASCPDQPPACGTYTTYQECSQHLDRCVPALAGTNCHHADGSSCDPCDRFSSDGRYTIWDFRSDGE